MRKKNISQSDIVRGTSFDKAQVSNWLTETVKNPREATIHKLAYFFECNIEWLASGKGEPYPQQKTETAENKGGFEVRKACKEQDVKLARIERAVFKTQCPGFFNDFFDFVGENYGENIEGVNKFLDELIISHGNYRDWVREKNKQGKVVRLSQKAI